MAPAALVLAVALAAAAVARVGAVWNSDAVVVDGQAVTCPCATVCRVWEPVFLEGGGAGVARSQPLCGVNPATCTAAAAPGTGIVVAVSATSIYWPGPSGPSGYSRVPFAKCSAPIRWTSAWVDAYNMSTAARPVRYDVSWQPAAASPSATRGFTLRLHWMPTNPDLYSFISSPYSAYLVTDFGVFNSSSARLSFEPLRSLRSQNQPSNEFIDSEYTYYDLIEMYYDVGTRAAAWYVLRACFVDDQTACWDSPRFHVMRSLGVRTFLFGGIEEGLSAMNLPREVVGSDSLPVIRLGGTVATELGMGVGLSDGVTATQLACPVGVCRGPFGGLTVQNTFAAWLSSGGQKCSTIDVTSALAPRPNPTRDVSVDSSLPVEIRSAYTPVAVLLPSSTVCNLPGYAGLVLEANTTVCDANGAVRYFGTLHSSSNAHLFPAVAPPTSRDLAANIETRLRLSFAWYADQVVVVHLGTHAYASWEAAISYGDTKYRLEKSGDFELWGGTVRAHIDFQSVVLAQVADVGPNIVAELDLAAFIRDGKSEFNLPHVLPAGLRALQTDRRYVVGLRAAVRVVTTADGFLVAGSNATYWSDPFHLLPSPATPNVSSLTLTSQLHLLNLTTAAAPFGVTLPLGGGGGGIPVVRLGGKVHMGIVGAFNLSDGSASFQLPGIGGPTWNGFLTARVRHTLSVITSASAGPVPQSWVSCMSLDVAEALRAAGALTGNAVGLPAYFTFKLPTTAPPDCTVLPPGSQDSTHGYALGLRMDVEVVDNAGGAVLLFQTFGAVTPLFHLHPALPTNSTPRGDRGNGNGTLVQVLLVLNVTAGGSESVSRMLAALAGGGAGVELRTAFSGLVGKPLDTVVIVAVVDHQTGRVYRFAWDAAANGRNGTDGGNGVTATSLPPRRRRLGGSDAPDACAAPDLSTATLSPAATAGAGMTVVLGVYLPPPSCAGVNATEADADAVATDASATVDGLTSAVINGATNAFAAAAAASLAASAGLDSATVVASLPSAGVVVDAGLIRSGSSADVPSGGAGAGASSGSGSGSDAAVVGGAVGSVVVVGALLALAGRAYWLRGTKTSKSAAGATDAAAPAKLVTNPLARTTALASYNKIVPPAVA